MPEPREVTIKTDERKIQALVELIDEAVKAKGLRIAEAAVVIAKDFTSQMEQQFQEQEAKAAAMPKKAKPGAS